MEMLSKIDSKKSSDSSSIAPTLLAWCSTKNNNISVIDLETKQNYVTFDGARISNTYPSWTHVKEIPNTKLLVSLHQDYRKSANMEIFDISKKGKANKIYSLGEVSGSKLVVGPGDVTYNPRRSILGAIPVIGRIAYHLFTIDTSASNASATINAYGVFLISDVNTNNYVFHLQAGSKTDWYGRCRWSTNTGEPLLFVKYDWNILNILDVEKKARILRNPVQLEKSGRMIWIDVCQSNGNLLVSGGWYNIIKIFDKREPKMVKTFEKGVYSNAQGFIHCVRWNPSGDMIASTSDDKTAKLLDFKTGKVLHTGTTSDENYAQSVCFL